MATFPLPRKCMSHKEVRENGGNIQKIEVENWSNWVIEYLIFMKKDDCSLSRFLKKDPTEVPIYFFYT